jgi:predicted MFS family arabinose efflux permease
VQVTDNNRTEKRNRASLVVVYATVFLDLVGFGIIIPVLPFLARAFGASGFWIGVLLTAYSAAQFLAAPVLGRLSDRHGRRPVLLLTLLGSTLSYLVMGLAGSLAMLIAARLLAGLFGGSIAAAQAYIADVTAPEERSKFMGILGAAIGMGFVVGPAIGALSSSYGASVPAYVASALCAVNLAFAFLRLKETRTAAERSRSGAPHLSLTHLFQALQRPALSRVLIASFLLMLGLVAMESTFALLGADKFQLDAAGLGYVFTFVGIVMALVQGGLVGRLSKKHGELKPALVGAIIFAAALAGLPYMPGLGSEIVLMGAVAFGWGLANPTVNTLVSRAAAADEQGGVLGLNQSAGALARAVGPLIAGALYDQSMYWPYVLAGAAAVVAAGFLTRLGTSGDGRLATARI